MKSNIYQAEVSYLKELNNLFIEMTAKNCNQQCKHCYIDFPKYSRKISDFISTDLVKQALCDTQGENIKWIYLTGAEPMTHPDFNSILRLCLKRANVCICTNGSFINEKKARFLKRVEEESSNEIIFKISIDHYDEVKNDDIRYRGAFRHGIFALKHLLKYDFMPIISVVNYYKLSKDDLWQGFSEVFKRYGLEDLEPSNLQIIPWHDVNFKLDDVCGEWHKLDCEFGRILTVNGIYTCPFLANDYRGRCGASFVDYNKKSSLETSFCNTCITSKKQLFSIIS
ncbi:radical SAM protein [bacterium]|nr:radical SAM protein [bacterium]